MQAVARYNYEEGRYAFTIPFAFRTKADIGARLVLPNGSERQLAAGRDYAIEGNQLIYILPRDHALVIYLDAPAPESAGPQPMQAFCTSAACAAILAGAGLEQGGTARQTAAQSPRGDSIASTMSGQECSGAGYAPTCGAGNDALYCPGSAQTVSLKSASLQTASAQSANAGMVVNAEPLAGAGPVASAAPAVAQAASLATASSPNAAATQTAEAARIAELENKLNEFIRHQETAEAAALAQAQAIAQDSQLNSLSEEGERQVNRIDASARLALEDIDLAAEEVEQSILGKASGLVAATRMADEAADSAKAAAGTAQETAAQLQASSATAVGQLEQRVAELEARLEEQSERAVTALNLAAVQAQTDVANASSRAQAQSYQASRLAGQAWPEQGFAIQANDLAARSVMALPEPLRYYPGRNCLYIARNGFIQTLGREFEEVGTAAQLSNTIRLLAPTSKGDVWSFFVAPTNQAQAASESAREAGEAASHAASSAASAEGSLKQVQGIADKALTQGTAQLNNINAQGAQASRTLATIRDNALDEIQAAGKSERNESVLYWQTARAEIRKEAEASSRSARDLWLDAHKDIAGVRQEAQAKAEAAARECQRQTAASQALTEQALSLSQCAWRAAFQASLDKAMPGIASVCCFEDLAARPSGVYFINPLLKQPLPFMGVFPLASLDQAIAYDGVFLIGAMPYPDQPNRPDIPYPDVPADVPEMQPPAAAGHWLPCGHSHA